MTDAQNTDYLRETTRFEPAAVEARWMKEWLGSHLFHAEPDPSREPYSIVIPPPNITGVLHMGHALNNTIQDVLTRYHRMLGENACWMVGTDHAGIATQNVVEKMLRAEGLTKEDLGREEFATRVWEWRLQYGGTIIEQLKSLGCACDYDRERFTFDEGYVRAVTRVFVALYEKGCIHKDSYLVNWCPRCGTAISDLEVAYKDMPGTLNFIRYPVDGGRSVTIATTRPETMLGDTAVAVHPDDERYKDVVGKTATLPLIGRELKIVADERVDPEFGSGALKITPAHDLTDFDIGRTHGLETVQAIGQDGRITAAGGPYAGLEVEEAAERVLADLRALGALEKVEDYAHSVATCDRCGTPIEPLISEQWFMDMDRLREPATEVVRDGRVRFTPARWGRVYIDWMEKLRPWCISRQLWWGHQLPVWYCENGHVNVAETEPQACADCGSVALTRETDVLDTWFSSALWPFATWGWPDETADLAYFYPTNLLSTAREIIFLWVARMAMMGLEFVGDVPFHDVYIHSVIQAADGRRMSKSLGTGIDPLEMIDKYGADATRFGCCSWQQPGRALQRREDRHGARLRQQALERGAARAAGERGAARRSAATPIRSIAGSRAVSSAVLAEVEAAVAVYNFAGRGRHALSLRLGRVLRLVSRDGQAAALRRRRACEGRGSRTRALAARPGRRVLHPFLPFVTEEIAAQYGAAPLLARRLPLHDERAPGAGRRGGGRASCRRPSRRCALSRRRRVPPGRYLRRVFVGDGDGAAGLYAGFAGVIRSLARIELRRGRAAPPTRTSSWCPAAGSRSPPMPPTRRRRSPGSSTARQARARSRAAQAKLANGLRRARARGRGRQGARPPGRGPADRDEVAARLAQLEGA